MGRTGVLARATLDAADDVLMFTAFPVLHLREFSKEIRLKSHRTDTDTFRTTDAGLGLFTTGLVVGDDCHGIGSLVPYGRGNCRDGPDAYP